MIKKLFSFFYIISFIVILQLNLNAQETCVTIDNGEVMGVIFRNTLQFYESNGHSWEIIQGMDMKLPSQSKGVISIHDGIIGVITNNRIQFYFLNESVQWEYIPYLDFIFPKNCQYVFGINEIIGAVINNKIQFYSFDELSKKWFLLLNSIIPELELLNGYTSIFGYNTGITIFNTRIGVIVYDKIFFYDLALGYPNTSWRVNEGMEMILPKGYEGAFNLFEDIIGVITKERIIFYDFFSNRWITVPDFEFRRR